MKEIEALSQCPFLKEQQSSSFVVLVSSLKEQVHQCQSKSRHHVAKFRNTIERILGLVAGGLVAYSLLAHSSDHYGCID